MTLKQFLILAMIGALIGLLVSGVEKWWQHEPVTTSKKVQVKKLPHFSLSTLDGKIWHSEEAKGKVLVLNFWATWCPPCREEMPLFNRLQEEFFERDVRFIGIAIDDQEAVQEFVNNFAVDFPILLGNTQSVAMSESLGNRFSALPYTVVVNKKGKIQLRHAGAINEAQLRPLLTALSK